MNTFVATFMVNTFAGILAPFRRAHSSRQAQPKPAHILAPFRQARAARQAQPTTARAAMDPATYAAMLAEAERIAAPYRRHVAQQIAALQPAHADTPASDFSEVEALLRRAGLLG